MVNYANPPLSQPPRCGVYGVQAGFLQFTETLFQQAHLTYALTRLLRQQAIIVAGLLLRGCA